MEFGDAMDQGEENERAQGQKEDFRGHDRGKDLADPGLVALEERDLPGRADIEGKVREDYEVLDKGLRKEDEPELFRADHLEEVGDDDDGKQEGDGLQPRKESDIAQHLLAAIAFCHLVGLADHL